MTYNNICKAKFISRPNRFVAHIEIDGQKEVAHVKNTGRCRELLTDGATVFVQKSDNPARKTKYDLIGVLKGGRMINMDSQIPNKVFGEWAQNSGFFGDLTVMKAEKSYGNSRFDYYLETEKDKIFVEVKGVTLEQDGVVLFPDAPTERGVKHINELCSCIDDGYRAYIFFIIQMDNVKYFTPNRKTHPEFADALKNAAEKGVGVYALDCKVSENSIVADSFVKTVL
ncbi:MAG: DNA/RNA nuclease SfsA [Oscillospiraceae bacterium]|nr:DNA/RNA nuclease SfsA [Oscillospiraceae bacterium]